MMNVKELTEQLMRGSEGLTMGPDLKVREAFTGDTSNLRRASVEFLHDFSEINNFIICESHIAVSSTLTDFMCHGYEAFAAFFYGAEIYQGVSLNLYDVPCCEQFYVLQKIPGTEDAVFTLKENRVRCCYEEECKIIYQVIVSLPEIIETYKQTIRSVFSDGSINYWKSIIIDDIRDDIDKRNKESLSMEMADFIQKLRYYNMFRQDSWFWEKPLSQLELSTFLTEAEIDSVKEILEVSDFSNYPEYYDSLRETESVK